MVFLFETIDKNIDFLGITSFYRINYVYLKYLGLILGLEEKTTIGFRIYSFLCQLFLYYPFCTVLITNWILNSTSLRGFAQNGYIVLVVFQGYVKYMFMTLNRKGFAKQVDMFKLDCFWTTEEEELKIMRKDLDFYKKARLLIMCSSAFSIGSSIVAPIFSNKYGGLPFSAWYPIDISESPYFEIAYFHQTLSIIIVGYCFVYVDVLLVGNLIYTGTQCSVLAYKVRNLGEEKDDRKRQCLLKKCVEHHRDIITFCKFADVVWGSLYFWQIATTSLTLCMTFFLLSLAERASFEFVYLMEYATAVSLIMLVPCWFATEMSIKSEQISYAAYNCNWICTSNDFKKDLAYFIHRSQAPLKFYAVDFFEISVDLFLKVVRTSMSYFAVLRNMNMSKEP